MLLTGHEAEIYTVKFSPDGSKIASGSRDRSIFLWNTYGECTNYKVLKGHTNAILEVHWSTDGTEIFSASADCSIGVWDIEKGDRIKKLREHESFVNSCCPSRRGPQYIVSGSDDRTCKYWDVRKKDSVDTFQHEFPLTSVCFSDDGTQIITGGLDNDVHVWDLRKGEIIFDMKGHTDTISGMAVSADGSYLLTNSMDNTLRIWDVRPYAPPQRCVKIFEGASHNFEQNLIKCAWAPDGSKVVSGSADRCVYVWDTTSRKILYKLPGHAGSVNEVTFHPTEPIIGSGGSDNNIYLGEIAA